MEFDDADVPFNDRFQCCICRDNEAWRSDDYLRLRLTVPRNHDDSFQLLGVHARCLNGVTSNVVELL